MLDVTLGGDVEVTLTGSSGDGVTWKNNSHIDAAMEDDLGGTFTVQDNASIELNAGSLVTANIFNIDGGNITLQGTDDGNTADEDAIAMIRAFHDGIINLNGGAIDVTSNKAGILRGADINLTGSTITNNGTLTIAGKLSNGADSKVNTAESSVAFAMTGGTLANNGTLNLGVLDVNNAIGGTNSIFTFQGGTFTNSGTTNVASGATFTTAGNFVLSGSGTLNLQSGAKADFGGENVVLNGKLNIADQATATVTGKVTFNGNSDAAADISGGQLKLDTAGTLTINDAVTSLGLTYNTDSKTFTSGYNNFSGAAGSTLYLDVAGLGLGETIAADQVDSLVESLKSTLGSGDYLINLQGVKIGLSKDAEADLSDDNTVDFGKVEDVLTSGVDSDQLNNAAIKVTGSQEMQGSVGQVQTDANSTVNVAAQTLKLNGFAATPNGAVTSTVLTQAGSGSDATVAGISMQQGSTVTVDVDAALGTAYVGAITTESGGSFAVAEGTNLKVVTTTTKVNALTGETETSPTLGDIGTSTKSIYSLQATGNIEANDVYAQTTNVESNGALTLNSLTTDQAEIKGTVNVAEDITATTATGTGTFNVDATAQVKATNLEADQASLAGSTQFATVNAQDAEYTGGTHNVSDTLAITSSLKVDGNAAVNVGKLTAASGVDIYVGSDGESGSAGSLSVTTLDLNGADLVVDPAFGRKSSFVGVTGFSDKKTDYEAGMINGNAYALQNAILSIGEKDEATVRALFADYLDEDDSLDRTGVGAIVYVAKNVSVTNGHQIVVDPEATLAPDDTLSSNKYDGADLYIGNNGALAIDVTAAAKSGVAALHFDKDAATIEAGSSAKIVLTGDYTQYDTLTLLSDNDADANSGLTFTPDGAQSITVETLNGLLQGSYSGGATFDVSSMEVNTDKVRSAYTDTSSAVRHSVISYLAKDTDWENQGRPEHNLDASRTHGAYAEGITYNSNTGEFSNDAGVLPPEQQGNYVIVANPAYDGANTQDEPQYLVYEKAFNSFLDELTRDSLSGAAADSAAHMAEFGGAAQVALKAGSATTDAIAGRMGMGAQNTAITYANNGQGAGIWVTPIYMSADSDGFDAQGVDYGTDISLYGVALGGDYTLANGLRIGAMFNVGSGDADGQGAGSAVTSDFDYYGFGLYAGYSFGQFSIVGDVSYTAVDNDIEANTNIDKLETSLDSTNLSVGVTGSYAFESASGVKVTPHVGLRYSNIDVDDYTVTGREHGTVGSYDADSLSVFSIPVGVTIATEFKSGTWSVKPSFDVTITGQFGDDEAEGTFKWAGVENIDSQLNSEIFDSFTYGASLGIAAQSESGIALGLAVGYTGSSNTDDLGVSANARFTF